MSCAAMFLSIAVASSTIAEAADCTWFEQPFGRGFDRRPNSPTTEFSAVRHEDRCEMKWLYYHHGETLKITDRNLDTKIGEPVSLRFDGGDSTLQLYIESERGVYQRRISEVLGDKGVVLAPATTVYGRASIYRLLCDGPCDVELPSGEYWVSLGRRDVPLAEIPKPLVLSKPVLVEGSLESYATERVVFAVAFIGGIAAVCGGAIATAVANAADEDAERTIQRAGHFTMLGGLGALVVSSVLLFGVFYSDEVALEVTSR